MIFNNKYIDRFKKRPKVFKLKTYSFLLNALISVIIPIYILISSNVIATFQLQSVPNPDYESHGNYFVIENRSAYSPGIPHQLTPKQVSDWKKNKHHQLIIKIPALRNAAIAFILLAIIKLWIDFLILHSDIQKDEL